MFIHFSDRYWFEIAELTAKELPISTVLTPISDVFKTSKVFEKTEILHSANFSSLEKVIALNKNNPYALSKADVLELSWAEVVFLTITDRNMRVPLSVHYRVQYYYELVRFWLNFLDIKGIDHLFFQATPHLGYDYALYAAAKKLGKKTTIFQETQIQNVMFYGDDYEKITKVDREYLEGIQSNGLREMVEPDLLKLVEAPSFWLRKSKSINEVVLKDMSDNSINALLIRSYRGLRRSLKTMAGGAKWKPIGTALAENRLTWELNRKIQSLYKQYKALTEKPIVSDKYVLFALHFQPERTTLPEGGVFENQLLAIDILARALPEGWWLYVREHPRQFQKNDRRKAHFRDLYYYERIKANKNVKLISVLENQDALLEGARMVASIKGSVGWEAMTRGKPSLVFARAWYSSSNACFLVSSVEDCREALSEAFEMDKETVLRHLYRFLIFNRPRMILASDFLEAAEKSVLGYAASVKNLANAIVRIARNA